MIRTILCPTDFSEFSSRALGVAVDMARWSGAQITLFHVAAIQGVAADVDFPYSVVPPLTDDDRRELQQSLIRFAEPATAAGVALQTAVPDGDPVDAILELAQTTTADLIVMGTHGRTGVDRWILGSVAEQVIAGAPCPVLSVSHGGWTEVEPPSAPFRRILCALDLHGSSGHTLAYALSLRQEAQAGLTVLHVLEDLPEDEIQAGMRLRVDSPNPAWHEIEAAAHDRLRQLLSEHAHGIDQVLLSGRADKEILRAAERLQADLIVVGRGGGANPPAKAFGSTSRHVVRGATCPVLTLGSK